jgi:hypothetical protein
MHMMTVFKFQNRNKNAKAVLTMMEHQIIHFLEGAVLQTDPM